MEKIADLRSSVHSATRQRFPNKSNVSLDIDFFDGWVGTAAQSNLWISGGKYRKMPSEMIKLDSKTIPSFKPSKSFNKSSTKAHITSLDFDDSGDLLISAAQDETLQVYNCREGKHEKTLFSKKYGCHLARFSHRQTNVVYASTKENDTLRFLSLHDNSFIRYFKGHERRVVSLEVNPASDTFLSTGKDNTVRLWDLNSPNCQGLLHIPAPSLASFDPTGSIFCVASHGTGSVMLYDLRNFDKEPFSTWTIKDDAFLQKITYPPRMPSWQTLSFSNDGKLIMLSTDGDAHYVLDAFTGDIKYRLTGHAPSTAQHETSGNTVFTPDGRHVISGNPGAAGDSSLVHWDLTLPVRSDKTVTPSHIIPTATTDSPHCLAFNPKTAMLATADTELFMWLPDLSSL